MSGGDETRGEPPGDGEMPELVDMTGNFGYNGVNAIEGRRGAWNTRRRGTYVAEDEMQFDDSTVFRFWSKIDTTGECWLWMGGRSDGYGLFGFGGRTYRAHRLAWELAKGPILPGLFVCHNCPGGDNRACVNPDHLWLGTNRQNIDDAVSKGRLPVAITGERNGQARLSAAQVAEVRHRYKVGGISQHQLAVVYGVSDRTIGGIVRGQQRRVPGCPEYTPRPPSPPRSRLTWDKAQEIRARYASGDTPRLWLAREFGVHDRTIERIVKWERWRAPR